jgi:cytochrome c2
MVSLWKQGAQFLSSFLCYESNNNNKKKSKLKMGDIEKGQKIFVQKYAQYHTIEEEGNHRLS